MGRSRIMQIALIIGSVLIIVGVGLIGWITSTQDERNVINVQLQEGTTETVEFENLGLIPGEECEYVLSLKKGEKNAYDLRLKFVELEEKTLKQFARVKIIFNEEVLHDELLADVFDGDELTVHVDFDSGKKTELKIVYYLPIEVGNEAKNAEAIFELLLTTNNE